MIQNPRFVWFLRVWLWSTLVSAWTPALAASALALRIDDGLNVSWALLLSAMVLASLSGATALVFRLDRELRASPETPLVRPWLFCAAHMLGSWTAGALCFLLMQSMTGLDVWYKLSAIVMASFLGARFIEAKTEGFLATRFPLPPDPPAASQTRSSAPIPPSPSPSQEVSQ